jgi:hypothetical protein
MNIESIVRRTVIIINGEEFIVNEENLTENVIEHHTLNDLCLSDNEDILHFLGH